MNKELFGVFGDASEFSRYRSEVEFDCVVESDSATVGIRDVALGIPGRSTVYQGDEGACVLWGEVYFDGDVATGTAKRVLERYREVGLDALSELNGSYVAFLDDGDGAVVATDAIRSWECFYADVDAGNGAGGSRLFGTAPGEVAAHLQSPDVRNDALAEFLHLSVVLGNRTTLEGLERVPFDGYLTRDGTEELSRFVYEPAEFDYVEELARRLQRAFTRRTKLPGRKGLLLSGGYDSRTFLAGIPDIDRSFTVGNRTSEEVGVAQRVSEQYGVPHTLLTVDDQYLTPGKEVIKYGNGIRESLHIHHAAYDAEIDVDAIYHGLLWDTFFRGHFLPRDRLNVLGYEVPQTHLRPDPNPAEVLVDEKFGFCAAEKSLVDGVEKEGDGRQMALDAVREEIDRQEHRYDSVYNAIDLVGIQNQPTMPFRKHLADQYIESLLAADRELLEWHLRTPPEYRNSRTLLKAIRRIDDDILKYRPPDRPYDSFYLNTALNFARKRLPFVSEFNGSWPDRVYHYDQNHLDQRLFSNCPEVHDLPPRLKLRINDAATWLNCVADRSDAVPPESLCSSFGAQSETPVDEVNSDFSR